MLDLIAVFGHGLCCAAFLGLGLHTARRRPALPGRGPFVVGCHATAAWSGSIALSLLAPSYPPLLNDISEILRNLSWLYLLLTLLRRIEPQQPGVPRRLPSRRSLAPLALLQAALALAHRLPSLGAVPWLPPLSWALSVVVCVLGLLLLENVLGRGDASTRWGLKYLCLGLGAIFSFDFFIYSDALLLQNLDEGFVAARGLISTFAVPLSALSAARMKSWTKEAEAGLGFDRAPPFRQVALVGSGLYLLLMAGIGFYIRQAGEIWGQSLQAAFLIGGGLLMAVVLASGRFKSQLRLLISKNFLTYKYDYREEWRRFIRMMSAHQPLSLGERTVHAIADMMDSPGGAIWILRPQDDAYLPDAAWNYHGARPSVAADAPLIRFLARKAWVIEINGGSRIGEDDPDAVLPGWIREHPRAWLVVPLIHRGEVLGFLLLDQARAPRQLDWEDRDLLKTAASHAASYLAEELAAEALGDAQRLEEFNRRFAFVVHDVKNVVGQMSLMLENAQRFGDNPEFQKDMLETVGNSVQRMKALLEQLSEKRRQPGAAIVRIDVRSLAGAAVERWQKTHAGIAAELPETAVIALGIEENLMAVLDLLIDNALGAAAGVILKLHSRDQRAIIEIQDNGPGMDADFVRKELFQPLRSTKTGGYGIGAYQTRHLIREMGGKMEVDTAPSRGTTMRVILPLSDRDAPFPASARFERVPE